MSEQNTVFENWLYSEECPINPDGLRTEEINAMRMTWQAATLESAERIATLEGEVEESEFVIKQTTTLLAEICLILKGDPPAKTLYGYHDLPKMVREIQANNHDLREALRYFVDSYGYVSFISDDDKESEEQVIAARKLLAATPAESLAKHDDKDI